MSEEDAEIEITEYLAFDPGALAGAIQEENWDQCWALMDRFFNLFHRDMAHKGFAHRFELLYDDPQTRPHALGFCNLVKEFMVILMNNPVVTISDQRFYKMLFHHEIIHNFIHLSGTIHTDPLIEKLLDSPLTILDEHAQKKMLLMLSLASELDITNIMNRTDKPYRMAAGLAYLCYFKNIDPQVHSNKIDVLDLMQDLDSLEPDEHLLGHCVRAFFMVSYLDDDDKHIVKRSINHYIKALNAKSFNDPKENITAQPVLEKSDKPRLVFYCEFFYQGHAMYRSWYRRLLALRDHFDMIALVSASDYHEQLEHDFDHVCQFEAGNMQETFDKIEQLQADIMFYPSVGMMIPSVRLTQQRFAPIQIMGLGHPAAAMNEQIDYVVEREELYDERAFPEDRYIQDHMPLVFTLQDELKNRALKPVAKKNDGEPLKVGIASSLIKINSRFLALVKELVEDCQYDVHLTFMLVCQGLDYAYMRETIAELFGTIPHTVLSNQPYEDYLDCLEEVDMLLNPFPFGHTNTAIDAMLLGKPFLAMSGHEPHSKTDELVANLFDLPAEFIASSAEDYAANFEKIADQIMTGAHDILDPAALRKQIEQSYDTLDYDYAGVFKWIYENHDTLQASPPGAFKVFSKL